MGEIKGKMLKCDACGEELFLKLVNVEKTFDPPSGCVNSYEIYETPPAGWGHPDLDFDGLTMLCPCCNEPMKKRTAQYLKDRVNLTNLYEAEMKSILNTVLYERRGKEKHEPIRAD